jgi:quercetin 2,3-dioxygenase
MGQTTRNLESISASARSLVVDGDPVSVLTDNDHVCLLLISEKPLQEPVAWYGPIVINTEVDS